MAAMDSFLITVDGTEHEVSTGTVQQLLDTSARFWLDLAGLDKSTADRLLLDTFGFHPLAVQDAEHFGQRPKVDPYDHFTLIVVYGATGSGQLVEVHCFYTENYLVTVHRDACPELTGLARRLEQRPDLRTDHVMLLYRVVDALIDGYFPVLADLDDRIDALEDAILQRPTDQQLGQLFDMKRSLIALRKVVTPQRDLFASLLSGAGTLPGMTPDAERYFRDLYDHLIRSRERRRLRQSRQGMPAQDDTSSWAARHRRMAKRKKRLIFAAPLALASTRWRVQISHFGAVQVRPGVSAFWWRSCLAVPGRVWRRVWAPS